MEAAGEASEELKSEAEALDRAGSDEAAKKLADALGKALEKLTPEERKKLAEKLAAMAKKRGATGRDGHGMRDLADRLSNDAGVEDLEKQLRDLANEDDESDESKEEGALDDAEDGLDDTERRFGGRQNGGEDGLGGAPLPMPGHRRGRRSQDRGPQGSAGNGAGAGGSHDNGTASHEGRTDRVEADAWKARAKGPMNASRAMPGAVTTFAPGRAGGTAIVPSTGDLATAAAKEVDGVEKSDVPEEYRDQVRQYFRP
jgi:hypothetical protein